MIKTNEKRFMILGWQDGRSAGEICGAGARCLPSPGTRGTRSDSPEYFMDYEYQRSLIKTFPPIFIGGKYWKN